MRNIYKLIYSYTYFIGSLTGKYKLLNNTITIMSPLKMADCTGAIEYNSPIIP